MTQRKMYDELWRRELQGDPQFVRASAYRRFVRRFETHRFEIVTRLVDQIPQENHARLLDLGCGTGEQLVRVAGRFDEIVGADISTVALEQARHCLDERGISRAILVEHSIEDPLGYPDGAFDTAICVGVIEHVVDVYGVVRELGRLVKPGGHLVAGVPNLAYIKHRVKLLAGGLPVTSHISSPEAGWDGGHLHAFTRATFLALLSWGGFRVERVSASGALAPYRNWWPSLLCGDLIVLARREGH